MSFHKDTFILRELKSPLENKLGVQLVLLTTNRVGTAIWTLV
jgi:hypothetical protein